MPSFMPSFMPPFMPSFMPSFMPPFMPSFMPSYMPSFMRSFMPPFMRSFLPPLSPARPSTYSKMGAIKPCEFRANIGSPSTMPSFVRGGQRRILEPAGLRGRRLSAESCGRRSGRRWPSGSLLQAGIRPIRSIALRYFLMRCTSRSVGTAMRERSLLSCRSASLTRRPIGLAAERRTKSS
jgi:hypothetical protein